MLSFLDSLCSALTRRDADAITQLLAHPMAATLPAGVRDEAAAMATDPGNAARAPLQAFVFAHRMAHLMASLRIPDPNAGLPERERAAPSRVRVPVHANAA